MLTEARAWPAKLSRPFDNYLARRQHTVGNVGVSYNTAFLCPMTIMIEDLLTTGMGTPIRLQRQRLRNKATKIETVGSHVCSETKVHRTTITADSTPLPVTERSAIVSAFRAMRHCIAKRSATLHHTHHSGNAIPEHDVQRETRLVRPRQIPQIPVHQLSSDLRLGDLDHVPLHGVIEIARVDHIALQQTSLAVSHLA